MKRSIENYHESSNDIARREVEPVCEACGEPLTQAELDKHFSVCWDCCGLLPTRQERIEAGEMEPEDMEDLVCQAEEQGEDR